MRLLIATTNPGKLTEIRSILAGLPIELATPIDFPGVPEPEESGESFIENARLKALAYGAATGWPAVAEDSGLEIDALGGEPGVRSARFNGGTYPERFREIEARLEAAGGERTARFVCALALARVGQIVFECRETVEGMIAQEPRGAGGFGYDPIFFYPPYGRTLAEVSAEEKEAVSHRGKAFRRLLDYLRAGIDEW